MITQSPPFGSNRGSGTSAPSQRHDIWKGVWRVADPKITMASVAAMVLGALAAAAAGPSSWGWLGLTVLGIFCIEAAKNASGEIFDWDSGTDLAVKDDERTPFSGGKRVLLDRLMGRRELAWVAALFYALGIIAGLAIVVLREPRVLWLGMLGVGLAFFYHSPPLKLAYRGLGELAVALAYGPVISVGTYLVQRQTIDLPIVWASLPLGLAIAAFLWVNELPDYCADRSVGKRTLVVRLGRPRAARGFALLVGLTYLGQALLPWGGAPYGVWLGFCGLPLAAIAAKQILRHAEEPRALIPAQKLTLLAFLVQAVTTGLGWVLFG